MFKDSVKRLLDNDTLLIGISELSEMSDVSPRQLRYWEKKAFIQSIENDTNSPRKYRLPVVAKVELIKHYLDEGFTLSKANEKAENKIHAVHHIRKVFSKSLKDIEMIDDRYTVISMGNFEPNGDRLLVIHDDQNDQLHYQIKSEGELIDLQQIRINGQ